METTEIGAIVAACLCILFGLVLCFAGYYLFRITLFLSAFIGTASLLYTAIPLDPWLAGLIAILGGLAIAMIALCIWPIGVFLVGAWSGFLLGCIMYVVFTVRGGCAW
jgi:Domain of unknown function (DUF4203)